MHSDKYELQTKQQLSYTFENALVLSNNKPAVKVMSHFSIEGSLTSGKKDIQIIDIQTVQIDKLCITVFYGTNWLRNHI